MRRDFLKRQLRHGHPFTSVCAPINVFDLFYTNHALRRVGLGYDCRYLHSSLWEWECDGRSHDDSVGQSRWRLFPDRNPKQMGTQIPSTPSVAPVWFNLNHCSCLSLHASKYEFYAGSIRQPVSFFHCLTEADRNQSRNRQRATPVRTVTNASLVPIRQLEEGRGWVTMVSPNTPSL